MNIVKENTVVQKMLDCRGLSCPQPVISTKGALDEIEEGLLTVIVDNEVSKTNVCRFLESQGLDSEVELVDKDFYIKTVKGREITSAEQTPDSIPCEAKEETRGIAVYISSEVMGRGDDELGRVLMATYIDTLSHFAPSIGEVIFVNSGVRLAVEGSPVLDAIKNLENAGVRILSCGTCLNHFGLKERLKVGEVSNMYAIIETISKSQKVIMP